MSIIGKKYKPSDNSYTINITDCSTYPYKNINPEYLAGNQFGGEAKICEIISEPLMVNITVYKGIENHSMIIVRYNNKDYMVLYYESNIIN